MKRWVLDRLGLAKPYRFERTLAVLVSLTLAIIVGGTALVFWLNGKLTPGTPLGWYFLYVTALITLGIVCSPWPRLATAVLSLATLEVGLGIGSAALFKLHLAEDALIPRNATNPVHRKWHPLLQAVVQPTARDEAARTTVFYNSQGLRGRERTPEELRTRKVIALFGGSTTVETAVPDGQTWGDRLEEMLGADRFAVLNHSSEMYSTVQIVLQTALYESPWGVKPTCAIYHVGGIDLGSSHIRNLDPGYADFQVPDLVDALGARRIGGDALSISPTLRYLGRLAVLAFDTVRPVEAPQGEESGAPDPALEALYVRNIHTISVLNRERGVRTLWVGEIWDRATLTGARERPDIWGPLVRPADAWPLMARLNGILKTEASALGDIYLDVPVDDFQPDDFVGQVHFAPKGSLKFAARLAPTVAEACR